MTTYSYHTNNPQEEEAARAKLIAAVLSHCTQFQAERVNLFLADGFRVYKGDGYEDAYVALLSKDGKSIAILPDGSYVLPTKGTDKFTSIDFDRVRKMDCKTPAAGLVKHRQQLVA